MPDWLHFKRDFAWICWDLQRVGKKAKYFRGWRGCGRPRSGWSCAVQLVRASVPTDKQWKREPSNDADLPASARSCPFQDLPLASARVYIPGVCSQIILNVFLQLLLFIKCKLGWDPVVCAISSDNDNQDNNYTKPDSSITVTYHLNNQPLKETEGWREQRSGPGRGSAAVDISRSPSSVAARIYTRCHRCHWSHLRRRWSTSQKHSGWGFHWLIVGRKKKKSSASVSQSIQISEFVISNDHISQLDIWFIEISRYPASVQILSPPVCTWMFPVCFCHIKSLWLCNSTILPWHISLFSSFFFFHSFFFCYFFCVITLGEH